ncbi:MAG: T9SS type A sorting domain-containing protein [Chitinophagales bacterium]|nr:T9SS type A sorting domain-containing protein [Chitinophagales bacterium]
MKSNLLLLPGILFLMGLNSINAQHYTSLNTAYGHLHCVNKEWAKHSDAVPDKDVQFNSDTDRIHFHLKTVIDYLSKNTPDNLSVEIKQKRLALLQSLEHYADRKVFPKNIHHTERRPYFIDHQGTHCAVGHLMAASGHSQLAQRIKSEHNFDYIKDIKTRGVAEWATASGFTIEDLAWIQPGYPPESIISAVGQGTNGPINAMHQKNNSQLIFAGVFDEVDNLPCLNIGYYQDEQLYCLGDGLAGTINDINIYEDDIIVSGQLSDGTTNYPLAIFSNESWSFIDVPQREGATGFAIRTSYDGYEISIAHSSIPEQQEVWQFMDNEWEKRLTVNGSILDVKFTSLGTCYAGHFNQAILHQAGLEDSVIYTNNLIISSHLNNEWQSFSNNISDTIHVIKGAGNAIYLGGSCSRSPSSNNVCMSRYSNGVMQPMILADHFFGFLEDIYVIKDIVFLDGRLLFGGDFHIEPLLGTYGENFAEYDLINNFVLAKANFNQAVNALTIMQGAIFLGGDFTQNLTDISVPHLAKTDLTITAINEVEQVSNLQLFPNPATDLLSIRGLKTDFDYSIFDINGQEIQKGHSSAPNIKVDLLTAGVYMINISTKSEKYSLKFIKQ